jgi:hypothetical protein
MSGRKGSDEYCVGIHMQVRPLQLRAGLMEGECVHVFDSKTFSAQFSPPLQVHKDLHRAIDQFLDQMAN